MEQAYEDTLSSISEKEVLMGTVVGMNKKEVVINIGYKSEGVVPISEFRYKPDLAIGDQVEVYIEKQEDKGGQMVVSHKTARVHNAWGKVNHAMETSEIITGYVKCRTKGGLIVDVFGIEAFLPGSQIDVKPIRDYDQFVGKNMEFKVVKINQEFKNVVVSHKALIEAELEAQKKQIIGGLEKGQVLEGTVKNITSYGVFVDLGGVDGLIHITDLSYGRVSHPEEVVKLDEKINVVILDFDDEKKRIALGLKQLQRPPMGCVERRPQRWRQGERQSDGDHRLRRVRGGGRRCGRPLARERDELEPAPAQPEGLPEGRPGDRVRGPEHRPRRAQDEPRHEAARHRSLGRDRVQIPVRSKHTAKVRNFTHFGIFAELEEGVDGLIHISDLSWTKRIKHPSEFCNVGDDIEVMVLEVDKENRRLSLGHKQVEENPWDVFANVFTPGSTHEGTLTGRAGQNFIVSLPYGVEGTVTAKNLKKADGSKAELEEKLPFVVLEFNAEARRIVLSHTRTFEEGEEVIEAAPQPSSRWRKAKSSQGRWQASASVKSVNEKVEKSTLGDLSVLSDLKSADGDQGARWQRHEKGEERRRRRRIAPSNSTKHIKSPVPAQVGPGFLLGMGMTLLDQGMIADEGTLSKCLF
jgi:small subunit ribosomal protein S1